MFQLMGRYMRQYKWYAIFSPIMMVLEVVADVLAPFLMAIIVDQAIPARDSNQVVRLGLIMVGVALWGLISGAVSAFMGSTAGFGLGANVRDAVFKKVQGFSFQQLDKFSVPSLITRLTNDCTMVSMVTMMTLRMAIRSPVMMVLAIFMAFTINARLALIFAVSLPVLAVTIVVVMLMAKSRFRLMQKNVDRVNGVIEEDLTSIRVIKSFVREEYETGRFGQRNDDVRDTMIKAGNLIIAIMPIMNLVVYASMIAIFWFGGLQVMEGTMGPGQIMSFISYCMQIMMSLMMLSMYFLQLTRGNTSAERIQEILDTEADLHSPAGGGIGEVVDGSVEFADVDFRYAGNSGDSLQDVTFSIKSGETVGIIGSTGSAKSTLVQLIPRLYDSTRGEVKVGGVDVRDYNLETLRNAVAFVLQKNTLFSGTLRENMQWGDATASDEEIIEAMRQAQAWEFVSQLPEGLDSWVEQGGSNFSGGQKQRLTIARALLKKPKILILDDSTSAVDTGTDAKIRKSFAEHLSEVTTFIIAQRINSIQGADRILVMDEGKITAMGTHAELLAGNEVYQDLYETQVKGAIAQ